MTKAEYVFEKVAVRLPKMTDLALKAEQAESFLSTLKRGTPEWNAASKRAQELRNIAQKDHEFLQTQRTAEQAATQPAPTTKKRRTSTPTPATSSVKGNTEAPVKGNKSNVDFNAWADTAKEHLKKNWGWYAGGAGVGITANTLLSD